MENLLDFCYYVTLFLIPIAVYSLFFNYKIDKRFYTSRDFIYLIKLYYATPAIKKYQKKCQLSLNEETKKILEYPKEVRSGIYTDNNFIYGADQKGNSLSLRFTVRSNLLSDIFLCLRLENGAIYTLPGDEIIKTYRLSDWHWKTKQLNIEILEPFKRLRITFNGFLSKDKNVEHVQFNFIWTAAAAPQFHPQDAATELLADALARQKWKDGNWLSLLGDERGYEQFGSVRGFVRGDSFTDDLFLNIPSCRTRFWTTDEKLAVKRSIHLFVAGRDGALISLWMKDLKKGCNELQYGNIIMNNGAILPITGTDLRLEFLTRETQLFTVHIYGTGKVYRSVFHVNLKKSVSCTEISNFPADCDQNSQQGKAIVEFWASDKVTSRDLPPPLLLNDKQTKTSSYITTFNDKESRNVKLTGGKGSSLAIMTSLPSSHFSIPDGFIITTNAFNKQLEINFNMKKSVSLLDDICCGRIKGDLQNACQETVKVFQNEKIFPDIRDTIISALKNIKKDSVINIDRYAVRSSAIGEDSEELSAAGQNDTFLGCVTTDDVIKSVLFCWASLFTYQSVQYRHQHGLPIATEMAVVVQRMVPADCAGVLFTNHPSTGNPALMVITANHGLGESVVSGRSEPDTIIIKRSWDNQNLSIKSKIQGLKNNRIVMVEEGGVVEQKGLEEFSITDAQALELSQVGVALEEKFGGARDIEWAFYKNRLFLLQSRPITTLFKWSDWEMLHEFDVATLSEDSVYTTANTGEILPGAVSVLAVSTILKAVDNAIQKSIENKFDTYVFKCLSTFQHHIFVDVIGGIHKRVEEEVNIVSKILDLAIFGHPIIDETIHTLALIRNGIATPMDKFQDLLIMTELAWKNEQITKECTNIVDNYDLGITNDNSSKDIYARITEAVEKFTDVAYCHSRTTRTSVTYQVLLMTVLVENSYDFTVDHYNDVAMLLASCDDVISAEIPTTLAKITKILIDSKVTEEFINIDSEKGREWLKENSPEAADIFEKFLEKHGHRAMGEFDVYNLTWSTNPSEVIKMIQTNCKSTSPKQEKITPTIDDVVANLISPKSLITRQILKFFMKKSRKAVGLREQTKSLTIKFVDKLRVAYNLLARKMALSGLIPDANLIFHLSHYEVGQILDNDSNGPLLINKALKRQKLFSKWNQLKFPEISYGIPRPERRDFIPRTGLSLIRCSGTPVCTGIIQARACVITDLAEIDQLNQGDILITYCTDIAWSPYFPILGGIVTELGGLVSHGAVIAREYGLPCIVGAKGATKLFKTGDTIILSGKDGIIELVQD